MERGQVAASRSRSGAAERRRAGRSGPRARKFLTIRSDQGEKAMNDKVSWGVLGAAKIAREKVIPAMQRGAMTRIDAIASRDLEVARKAASALGIPKAY